MSVDRIVGKRYPVTISCSASRRIFPFILIAIPWGYKSAITPCAITCCRLRKPGLWDSPCFLHRHSHPVYRHCLVGTDEDAEGGIDDRDPCSYIVGVGTYEGIEGRVVDVYMVLPLFEWLSERIG